VEIAEILLRLSGDDAGASGAVTGLKARLDELSGKSIRIDVDVNPAERKLTGLRARLAEMSGKDLAVKVDDATATGKIDRLKLKLDEMRNKTVDVKVDTSQASGALDVLKTKWGAISAAAVTVGPQILGALGQAGAGAGALGVAVAAAGAAFGVLGEAAKLQLTTAMTQSKKMSAQIVSDQKKVQTAQNSVTTAYATGTAKTQASANLRLALAQQQLAKDKQLQASQGNLAQQVVKAGQDMKKSFIAALGPGTQQLFQGLLSAMGTIKSALPDLSGPFLTLGTAIKNALQSPAITSGIKQLIDGFGKIVTASAPLVGPIIKGFINLGVIFEHIAIAAMPALVKLTQEFVGWLGKIANSTGTPKFAAEIQKWIDMFKTVVRDIGKIITALAPLFASAAGFQPLIVAATSLAGWFAKLLVSLGPVGRLLAGGLGLALIAGKFSSLAGPLGAVVTGATKLAPLLSKLGGAAVAGLLSAFPKLIPLFWALDGAVTAFVPAMAAAALAVAPFVLAVLGIGALVAAVIIFHKQIEAAIVAAWNWIKSHVKVIVEAIIVVITGPFGAMVLLVIHFHKQIEAAIKAAWDWIKGAISDALKFIGKLLDDAWKGIEKGVSAAWKLISKAVSDGVSAVVKFVESLPGKAVRALGDIGKTLWNAGIHLIEGFIHGALSVIGDVVNLGKKIVDSIGNAVTSLLGISSPSKVAHAWGVAVGQGLVDGLTSKQGAVATAAGKLALAAASAGNGLDAYANTSWYQGATQNDRAIITKSESQIAQGQALGQQITNHFTMQSLTPADPATLSKISATVSEAHRRNTPTTVKR
jgi:hypothetical protein